MSENQGPSELEKKPESGIRPRPRGGQPGTPSGLALIEQKELRERDTVRNSKPKKVAKAPSAKALKGKAAKHPVSKPGSKKGPGKPKSSQAPQEKPKVQEPERETTSKSKKREPTPVKLPIEEEAEGDEEEQGEEEDDEESEDEEIQANKPSFISEMRMRTKRGTKVDRLMKNENVGYDAFWEENKYFGKVDDLSDDSEEYDFEKELQNKNEKELDSFDSDFGMSSESKSSDEADGEETDGNETARAKKNKFIEDRKLSRSAGYEGKGNSDGKPRIKKKKKQYTMNLDIEREVVKVAVKKEEKKKKVVKRDTSTEWKPRFIHEIYTQEKLLRDAVAQEYLNKYDLVRYRSH